jgi:predicted transcriptional regulator YdeE
MEPVFKDLPEMKVMGVGKVISVPMEEIPPLWQKFEEVNKTMPNVQQPIQCLGLEMYEADFETTGKFFYMPSFVVTSIEEIPEGLTAKTLPANTYAVFTHRGSIATLHSTFMHIYKEWLPNSGYKLAAGYDFEWYDHRFKGMSPDNEVDIYLPIKPIAADV